MMNKNKIKSQDGFTLIEVIIYITIIGAVLSAFVAYFLSLSNIRNKTYAVQEVQGNVRTVFDVITQKIQSANAVNSSTSVFGSDPGLLSLSMSSGALNPTIIQLDEDNGVLQIKEGLSDYVSITSDEVKVSNLQFTDLTSASTRENIRIEYTIDYATSTDVSFEYGQSIQTAVSVRQ